MDVHPPHEPIHTFKDFSLHILTITVGLLIAVGIEGLVELHREHTLVREARQTMHEEIAANTQSMQDAVATLDKDASEINADIAILTRILKNPKDLDAQNASLNAHFAVKSLDQTAWKTAQTTGALAYMPYQEAGRYSSVYDMQDDFLKDQEKILDDEAQFIGVITQTNSNRDPLTAQQAAQELQRLGIWKAHLSYLDLIAKATLANDQAFLEGKQGPKSMNTDLK